MLFGSGALLALAPTMMPDGYSWTEHGISESAAQGIDGAWLARMGFVVFGLAVIWLTSLRAGVWGTAGTVLHMCFGVCMFGVAAFSTRPWSDDATYVKSEDLLHSVFASTMGFAFIVGTASVLVARRLQIRRVALLDLGAVVITTALSAAMGVFPEIYGALQRLMFLVAYCWYANEAHQQQRHHASQRRSP
ncbi:MAG TPA: DUF998 domain-containing protein [Ilumatobacteraceae bacterium]|nr:DUF998 domain-containing protein [Ilumatobacteraceae bacterium]